MTAFPALAGDLDDGAAVFRYVPVAHLRDEWPRLARGLAEVRESNGEPWISEDVYAALLHGRAALYVIEDDAGELEGFGIFEVTNFSYEFRARLNIWIGWSRRRSNGHLGVEMARKIARALGIDSIVFSTPQKNAWVEKFKPLHTWYEVGT